MDYVSLSLNQTITYGISYPALNYVQVHIKIQLPRQKHIASIIFQVKRFLVRFIQVFGIVSKTRIAPVRIAKVKELASKNKVEKKELSPSRNKNEQSPFCFGKLDDQFKEKLTWQVPERFNTKFSNARVWGTRGAVITKDNELVFDLSREFKVDRPIEHTIYATILLEKVRYYSGSTAVLASAGANVYFHWLFDILPRIGILEEGGIIDKVDNFILGYTGLIFQQETLGLLGIEEDKIIASTNNWKFHVECEQLYVPSLFSTHDMVSDFQTSFLRNKFLTKRKIPSKKERIYISRQSSIGRKIGNEEEFLSVLHKYDIMTYQLENLTFREQIELFSNAEIIIGSHGSGFSNIVFCEPGTKVIDLFPKSFINPCFWSIANNVELHYTYILTDNIKNNNNPQHDDIYITSEQMGFIEQVLSLN